VSARLAGSARVPGDKSTAHRALILAALARGSSRISGAPGSLDVACTRSCVEALGASVVEEAGAWVVKPPAAPVEGLELDAGNSGTTARLLAGALAGRSCPVTIIGDDSLSRRPMERVAAPLRALGAKVGTREGCLPLVVEAAALRAADWTSVVPSAQVKSAFLFAALGAEGESSYREAVPTRDHGERLLREFGAHLRRGEEGELRLTGRRPLEGCAVTVQGDPSSAAVFLTLATLLPGSELCVEDVDRSPTRRGFAQVLRDMGAPLVEQDDGAIGVRSLVDEVPLLALAAARARGESVFEGLGELRVKETDRLSALVGLLRDLGVPCELRGDDLAIQGGGPLRPLDLDVRGDHRLAMLAAVLALVVPGSTVRREPCVAVSWPSFYDDLEALVR
jgi:3-phosphoshikimate 1-carboxyvinyltransferase